MRPVRTVSARLAVACAACLTLVPLALLGAACGGAESTPESTAGSAVSIGVFQFGPDPDTDAAYEGLVAGLAAAGYTEGENLRIDRRDCGGDEAVVAQVAQEFAAADLDAVVPLTTPCLVAAAASVRETPVVFTSVYDPMTAGVAQSPDKHPANLTGVYSPPPVDETLDLIRECLPGTTVIGTVSNPGETNSSLAVKRMQAYCDAHGLTLATARAGSPGAVGAAATELLKDWSGAGGADAVGALYITGDNTVMAAFADVLAVADAHRVPVFLNDPGFVDQGAVAGLGPDFEAAGEAGGRLLAEVLDGADPASLALRRCDETRLCVDPATAAALGLSLPQPVLDRADETVGAEP